MAMNGGQEAAVAIRTCIFDMVGKSHDTRSKGQPVHSLCVRIEVEHVVLVNLS